YSSGTGRFLSEDPNMGVPFDPLTLHHYLYTRNDPVNRIDPSGRVTLVEVATALSIRVTLLQIVALHAFDIALGANSALVLIELDKPAFAARTKAINVISETSDPQLIRDAERVVAYADFLIGVGSADIAAAQAVLDLANASLSFGFDLAD